MKCMEIRKVLERQGNLTFKYKSQYYTIKKCKRIFHSKYLLYDTDNLPQQSVSLDALFYQAYLFDGSHICEVEDSIIELCSSDDSLYLTYDAIRHNVIVNYAEVLFHYNEIYYWIAYADKGISYLTDDFGNTQYFDSAYNLFEYARINNKSLKEIWADVVIDSC